MGGLASKQMGTLSSPILSLERLLDKTRKTDPPLTPEERRQYFLE